jgi:hypothetical protein
VNMTQILLVWILTEMAMKPCIQVACTLVIITHFCESNLQSHPGPFDGKNFKGRIAFSSDGNYNDEDDWGALRR